MRHVLKKEEVAAAWVAQDRIYAHTSTRNLSFFTGFDRLYSYRTCVASRIDTPSGDTVMFVTTYPYSVTTNSHLACLNDILRKANHLTIIRTPCECPTSVSNLPSVWRALVVEAKHLWDKASRARQNRPYLLHQGNAALCQANRLVDLFGADVVDGVKADTIEGLQEELRINQAILELRA